MVLVALASACGGSGSGDASPPSGPSSSPQNVAGKSLFTSNCGGCHTLSDAGASGSVGPNLDDLQPDQATVSHQVSNGGGSMPAFAGKLTDAEITAVAAYVSSVAGR